MSPDQLVEDFEESELPLDSESNPKNIFFKSHTNNYFQGLIESISDAIVTVDSDANIVFFSAAAERIFGHSYAEVINQSIDVIFAPAYHGRIKHNIRNFLETEKLLHFKRQAREVHGRRKDGSVFPASFSSDVFFHDNQPAFTIIFSDISKTYDDTETLILAQERFSLAVEATNDGLWDWNIVDDAVYYGPNWFDLIGIQPSQFAGQLDPWMARLHPEDHDAVFMALSAVKKGRQRTLEIETRIQLADESYRWFLLRGVGVKNSDGVVERIVGAASDVTSYKTAEEHAAQIAFHDILTDLPNRQSLLIRLEQMLRLGKNKNGNSQFALFVLDLDRFRVVNESLGDSAGDDALRLVSSRIKSQVRNSDFVARLSGDQFAVLASGITASHSGKVRAERMRDCITEPLHLKDETPVLLDANIGVRYWDGEDLSAEDALRDAILALRESKKRNSINVTEFYPELQEDLLNAVRYENDLRTAIITGKIEAHYQPIVDSVTGRPTGFEALARLWHPERGLIPPSEFIPIAEETGLISQLANEILRQATHQLADWRKEFPAMEHLTMAINLSPVQFEGQDIVGDIKTILDEAGLEGRDLKVEITENLMMENSEHTTAILNEIRELGIQVCIDDFGTGYSSLSQLRDFKFDTLKIDRSFIANIMTEPRDAEMVRTIIQLGQNIGMNIVVEGVEEIAQLNLLKELGCNFLQGFLLSKPLNADDAKQWVHGWSMEDPNINPCVPPPSVTMSLKEIN